MKEVQLIKYDDNGHIVKRINGIGDNRIDKKSKYIKETEEEERIKEEKRNNRKRNNKTEASK